MKSASLPTHYQSSHINTHHRGGGEFDVKCSAQSGCSSPAQSPHHPFAVSTCAIAPLLWQLWFTQSPRESTEYCTHALSCHGYSTFFLLWDIHNSYKPMHSLEHGFSNLLTSRNIYVERPICAMKNKEIVNMCKIFREFTWTFCHCLLQACMSLFLLLNTKEDVLKNFGKQTVDGSHWCP